VRALVIGAGISGHAALRLLFGDGYRVVVYDSDPAALEGLEGAEATQGGAWDPALIEGVDLVVASPGVPPHAPPIRDALAAGLPIWGELELASRHLEVPLLAVTATNGKTTITQLALAMLQASGLRAAAVGNIGVPLSDAVGGAWDVLVVETSSFQLRFIERFHPKVAVLLNVAPDHLDWHGDFEAYLAAKARIHQNQEPSDLLMFDADDPGALRAVAGAKAARHPVSGFRRPPGGSGPEQGRLWMGDLGVELARLPFTDPIFLVDAAAAGRAALEMGAAAPGVTAALHQFQPPSHRREVVGTWDGVTWVDDSKATNPHAAVAAIRAYPAVILIAGGRNKGLDVAAISAEKRLRHVIGIGEAGPEMVAAATAGTMVADLDEAVALADRLARPGDVVLLAPGCASFDMFHSYAHRGEVFAAAVRRRKEG
jgi:UDP-N-acetylmuramoylalanine--D-glutamate ligase